VNDRQLAATSIALKQKESGERFAALDLIIDAGTHEVFRNGDPLRLPKLSYQLLLALVRAAPNMLSTDALIAEVWGGRVVSNETVTQRVKLLRRALNDHADDPTYIGVVRGEGYRLLVDVTRLPRAEPEPDGIAVLRRTPLRVGLALVALAAGLLAAMIAWQPIPQQPKTPSPSDRAQPRVAVLPFKNLSDDPQQRYFADGLTEELIGELSRIPALRVAGRSSSFLFEADNASISELSSALSVNYLVEGSVRWDGSDARVSATLVSVADGYQVWSETYVASLDSVFTVQQQIAVAVASALEVEFGLSQSLNPDNAPSGRAFAQFLRGQALFWNHTPETNELAIEAYQQAVALEPDFVRAWVGLSYAYGGRSRDPALTDTALADMAFAAEHAVALAPESWAAQAVMAWVLMSNHAFAEAERVMAHALALRERSESWYESVNCPVACYFQQLGRVSDALAEARKMQDIDPLSPSADLSIWLYLLGRRDESLDAFARYQALLPRPWEARTFSRWLAMEDDDPAVMEPHLQGTPFAGKWGVPELMLPALSDFTNPELTLPRGSRALLAIYAARHADNELAMRLLAQEYLQPGFGAYFLLWHPLLAAVRATPEFSAFVTRLGLVDAWRSTGQWGDYCREDEGIVVCR